MKNNICAKKMEEKKSSESTRIMEVFFVLLRDKCKTETISI